MTEHKLRAVSLFAGVEGFGLAAQRAGIEVVAAVEIDKAARSVIARQFPDTRLYEDVKKVHAPTTCKGCDDCLPGRVDAVFGGFPCQDLSVAGRRAGLAGLRSGLFYELARIISETRPRWVVLENVPGLLSSHEGRDMAAVVGTMGDLGYGWAYRVLDAQFFGVPQRRRRVFFVGHLGDGAAPVEILLEPEGRAGDSAPRRAPGTVVAALTANGVGTCGADDNQGQAGHLIAHTLTGEGFDASEDGTGRGTPIIAFAWQAGGNNDASGAFNDDGTTPCLPRSQTLAIHSSNIAVRRLTPKECERLQGFPDDWTAGQADGPRYKQMGNAVAVPVVEWILRRLVAAHNRTGQNGRAA